MTIEARPSTVAIDATSLVVVKGPVNSPVVWSLEGNGTLEPFSLVTDGSGVAAAKLTPTGSVGDSLVVSVNYAE
jgi:hypothetical protein